MRVETANNLNESWTFPVKYANIELIPILAPEVFMPVQKVCVVCGRSFSVPPCRQHTASTCSNGCAVAVRAKSRERKAVQVCRGCGKEFEIPRSHQTRRIYCSMECRGKSSHAKKRMSDRVAGDKNPRWKGGETEHSMGYVYQHAASHPFSSNGHVFKHRLVMEKWLIEENQNSEYLVKLGDNFYLSPEYIVHHLDWDKSNNNRENLIVCTASAHARLHQGKAPEEGTYWPKTAKIKLGRKEKTYV